MALSVIVMLVVALVIPAFGGDVRESDIGTTCEEGGLWHFVHKQIPESAEAGTLTATFSSGVEIVVANKVLLTTQFYEVFASGELLAASDDIEGGTLGLSHVVCDVDVTTTATPRDTTLPSWPAGSVLSVAGTSETTVTVDWSANPATDDVEVTEYRLYVLRDNTTRVCDEAGDCPRQRLMQTVVGTSATVSGLAASTSYTIRVEAVDLAGNESSEPSPDASTRQHEPQPHTKNLTSPRWWRSTRRTKTAPPPISRAGSGSIRCSVSPTPPARPSPPDYGQATRQPTTPPTTSKCWTTPSPSFPPTWPPVTVSTTIWARSAAG